MATLHPSQGIQGGGSKIEVSENKHVQGCWWNLKSCLGRINVTVQKELIATAPPAPHQGHFFAKEVRYAILSLRIYRHKPFQVTYHKFLSSWVQASVRSRSLSSMLSACLQDETGEKTPKRVFSSALVK